MTLSDRCWESASGLNSWGYARRRVNGRMEQVHRVVYEEYVGPIPEGFEVDHLCNNPPCYNPSTPARTIVRKGTRTITSRGMAHEHVRGVSASDGGSRKHAFGHVGRGLL